MCYNKYIIKKERGAYNMATVFEIKRETETVYGIKTVSGACIWYNSREERDNAYLDMQN